MSDTSTTITPEDQRPPKPDTPLPPNYQWVWVEERTDSHGKVNRAHWRKWPTRFKPKAPAKKRGPKPGRPRFTSELHAVHLYEQLAVPLAFFVGRGGDIWEQEIIRNCQKAIEDARTFINRFTSTGEHDETDST